MNADELAPWLARVEARQASYRGQVGALRLRLLHVVARLLSAGRRRPRETTDAALQMPWLPCWPGLTARPVHDAARYEWAARLREAAPAIRAELQAVLAEFERARYDSELNTRPWRTYYFFLQGEPVAEHLTACPRTAEVLARLPHNGLHVCFSAIEPGGGLNPHTGPTNTSLTAHLGLLDCDGARLHAGNRVLDYRENEVLLFDDSFVHWVEHHGPKTRYTLMVTLWHPDLNALERLLLGRLIRVPE